MAKKKEIKREYYSLENILKTDSLFNWIIGGKGNGKTTSVLTWLLEQYIKKGDEFVLLRRYDLDIRSSNMRLVFSDIQDRGVIQELTGSQYNNIVYYQRAFYLAYEDDNGKIVKEPNPFCHVFSNSLYFRNNGVQLPRVKSILYDDFLTDDVNDEEDAINFLRNVSTFKRRKSTEDFKIFMTANTVSTQSSYFDLFGVKAEDLEKGNVYVIENDLDGEKVRIAIEYCDNSNIAQTDNNFFNMFTKFNPRVNMIISGEWEMLPTKMITDLPENDRYNSIFTFFIQFKDYTFKGDIIETGGDFVITFAPKTTPIKDEEDTIIYNPDELQLKPKINYLYSVYQVVPQLKITQIIRDIMIREQYYCANAKTGNTIKSILNQMK